MLSRSSGVNRPIRPASSGANSANRGSSLASSSMTSALPAASLPTKTTSTSRMIPLSTTFWISRATLPSNVAPSNPMTRYSSGPSVTVSSCCGW